MIPIFSFSLYVGRSTEYLWDRCAFHLFLFCYPPDPFHATSQIVLAHICEGTTRKIRCVLVLMWELITSQYG